eukprot:jgi/Ulvmu1/3503/UM162_0010.1
MLRGFRSRIGLQLHSKGNSLPDHNRRQRDRWLTGTRRSQSRSACNMEGAAKYALESFGFEGKCVLITGGSTGIGQAAVKQFAQLGAKVYTCARSEDALAGCVNELKEQGLKVDGCPADVIDEQSAKDLVSKATDFFGGKLDVLVNNVGVNTRKPVLDGTNEDFTFVMNTNVHSALNLCRLCYPYLKVSESASIVFNSSVAGGPTALKSGVVYAMSKASLNQLAKNLTCEWAGQGIRVNSVAPWYTATPLANVVLKDEEFKKGVIERTPIGRIATVDEVAGVMVFLASKAASYITGQTIQVDGGYSVKGYY